MICKNCGTNNSDNARFCAYCASPLTTSGKYKKPQNRNRKNNNNKIIGIYLAFVSLIIIILGGYLVLNSDIFKDEISVDAVTLQGNYEMNGDRYVLSTNENVIVVPSVTSSDSSYELEYEIEDIAAANIKQLGDRCSVVGFKETDTNLKIYSDDKILRVVKLSFKDKTSESEQVADVSDNSSNLNNSSNSSNSNNNYINRNNNSSNYSNNNSNNYPKSNYSNNSNNSYYADNNNDSNDNNTEESIPTAELDILVSNYLKVYERAIYYGDFDEVSDYITYNGPLYKQLKKSIPSTYEKGTTVALNSYEKKDTKKLSNGEYKVSYVVEWTVNNQEGTRIQTEYADYIIQKDGYEYKIDRLENWEILSKVYQ